MLPRLAVVMACGWVGLVLAAPLLPGWAGAWLYGIGSFVCHQRPERSLHLAGFQLPVCARCVGLYSGLAVAVAGTWLHADPRRPVRRMAPRIALRLAVAAAIPTGLTVVLEAAGLWFPSNAIRATAGFPLGLFVGVVVMDALATLHYDECAPPQPTAPRPPPPSI